MAEMANEMVDASIQTALEEGVFGYQIITDHAADLPTVKVNRLQVIKVLLNLIHNAAQAMHESTSITGKIWVSTALGADGREVCVNVRDDGPGISADLQTEVFQPFITTKSHGLGMGLTISRALIEANGGKLWHSQNDGRGATFHFTLPISS
jgi:two-component system sensor kinase FixL